jgi:sterol desaturase/sphingolipid hydroxylase (fatty acid hydroxylase superfamily)
LSDLFHAPQFIAFLLNVVRLCAWLLLLAAIFLPLERLWTLRPQKLLRKSTLEDLAYYFISGIVPNILMAVPLSLAAYAAYAFVPASVHATVAGWPLWLRAASAFVVADLGFYWGHRWAHEFPFLWRFHSIHHSPQHVYFLISARAHPIDFVFIHLCGLIPIYILGLGAPQSVQSSLVPTLIMLLATVWGFFIHANVRWRFGPLERLIATPGFHHWHHTRSGLRDRNYASMLPCWDWMFGTWHVPKEWPADYGIDTKLPDSIVGQMIHPLRDTPEERVPEPAE